MVISMAIEFLFFDGDKLTFVTNNGLEVVLPIALYTLDLISTTPNDHQLSPLGIPTSIYVLTTKKHCLQMVNVDTGLSTCPYTHRNDLNKENCTIW